MSAKKEKDFASSWERIRAKGRFKYIISRGMLYGLLLFAVWFFITVLEINFSEFKKAIFEQNQSYWIRKCAIWFCVFVTQGLFFASYRWKKNESDFLYLSQWKRS